MHDQLPWRVPRTLSSSAPAAELNETTARDPDDPNSDHEYDPWGTLMRLLRSYVRPYLPRLMVAFVFMAGIAITTASLAWLLDPAIKLIFIEKDQSMVLIIPVAIVAVSLLRAAATFAQTYMMSRIGQQIVVQIQEQLVRHFVHLDLASLNDRHKGKVMARFQNSTIIAQATSQAITAIVRDSMIVIALLGVMFFQDVPLALVACAVIPLVLYNSYRQGAVTRKATVKSMRESGIINSLVYDSVDGNRIVKSYGREEFEIDRTVDRLHRRMRHQMKAIRARALASPVTEAVTGLGIAAAIAYGGWQGISRNLELNEFVSFLAAVMMAYRPMKTLTNLNLTMTQGLTAAEHVFMELDREPQVQDAPDAKPLVLNEPRIEFRGVSFRYRGAPKDALERLDLSIEPHQTVALVGPSGAGKSTLINLVLRFADPRRGQVLISGQDIRGVTQASLRQHIALVTQEPFLFDDTIRANIAYGRSGASEHEIIAAAEAAAAHEFIVETRDGYDTRIGQGGIKLSGGQRQRLAIARAMLKDAPILLLDEATSALDSVSEQLVQEAFERLRQNRTVIVIAHRLSTVMKADALHVFDRGRLVESGTHAALIEQQGLYSRLYTTQFANDDDLAEAHASLAGALR